MDFRPMPTDFQLNKLLFFKESNYNQITRKTYWGLYLNYIADLEEEFNKDLGEFSQEEIVYYLNEIREKSEQTISQANSFINKYMEWYSKYYNKDEKKFDLTIKKEKDNSWYITKRDFFNMCSNMMKNTTIANIIPLVFARYGITGKELIYMRNVKWNDIDFKNSKVAIKNLDENIISYMPVDSDFLKWMKNLKKYNKQVYEDEKFINNHVIATQTSNDIIANYNSINTKAFASFKSLNMKRISFMTLFNCAVIDYIHETYSNSIPQSNNELINSLFLYYPDENLDVGKLRTIKKLYSEVFDDTETLRTYGRARRNSTYKKSVEKDTELKYSKNISTNEIVIKRNLAYIIIENVSKNEKVKINKEVIDKIKDYKWRLNSSGYVVTGKRLIVRHLSNFILDKEEYCKIEYLNGNKLDCTIENLKVVGLY